jgi:hypothetical protein
MNTYHDQDRLDVVLFATGQGRVGFEARHVRSARPAVESVETANIAAALGLPPSLPGAARQILTVKLAERDCERMVNGPVDLVSLPISAIHPVPPMVAARTGLRGLRALAWVPGTDRELVLLFSPEVLE